MNTSVRLKYQRQGYLTKTFIPGEKFEAFRAIISAIKRGDLKEGFHFKLKEKEFRNDLQPNVFTYDEVFLDILMENKLPQLVTECIGDNMTLVNIALVNSTPPGYMSTWHSDDFKKPIHKLIYYPSFDEKPAQRMEVLKGHVKPSNNRLTYNKYTRVIEPKLFSFNKRTIYSNDQDYLFVNTQVMHRAMPVIREPSALRVLYSFRERFDSLQEKLDYVRYSNTTVEELDALTSSYENKIGVYATT